MGAGSRRPARFSRPFPPSDSPVPPTTNYRVVDSIYYSVPYTRTVYIILLPFETSATYYYYYAGARRAFCDISDDARPKDAAKRGSRRTTTRGAHVPTTRSGGGNVTIIAADRIKTVTGNEKKIKNVYKRTSRSTY